MKIANWQLDTPVSSMMKPIYPVRLSLHISILPGAHNSIVTLRRHAATDQQLYRTEFLSPTRIALTYIKVVKALTNYDYQLNQHLWSFREIRAPFMKENCTIVSWSWEEYFSISPVSCDNSVHAIIPCLLVIFATMQVWVYVAVLLLKIRRHEHNTRCLVVVLGCWFSYVPEVLEPCGFAWSSIECSKVKIKSISKSKVLR